MGGGHSPFAHFHGLAADNLLEASIVSADGQHRVVNAFSDPDYFWAIRGGGGSAWGVCHSTWHLIAEQQGNAKYSYLGHNLSYLQNTCSSEQSPHSSSAAQRFE